MSDKMMGVEIGLTSLGLLVLLVLFRMPVGLALLGVSFGGLWALMGWRVAWGALGVVPYHFAANWVLSSLPMFLLLGYICHNTELTSGLFRFARSLFAHVPGGLAIASIIGVSGFSAVSGSSIACAATVGRAAIPEMLKARYHPELATGTLAAAGTIGALIPPSIILILYGVIAQVPITPLFLGGLGAGVLTAMGYMMVVVLRVRRAPHLAPPVDRSISASQKVSALKETWPVLLLVLSIFGGIFGGFFTPTEGGAVGASIACVIAMVKGTLTVQRFAVSISETAITTSALLIIGIGASLLTRLLSLSGTDIFLTDAITAWNATPMTLIVGLVALYFLLGCFIDPIGSMLITLPIVLPLVSNAGFSLVWFGVVLAKLLEIGMITPPVGMNVFVIKGVVGDLVATSAIFRGIFWFLVMDLIVLTILIAAPETIMFLPYVLGL